MQEPQITAEDRERLAKTKYKEWFQECFDETFGDAFDRRVVETHKAAGTKPEPPQQQQSRDNGKQEQKSPRRSLLSIALSDTFGF